MQGKRLNRKTRALIRECHREGFKVAMIAKDFGVHIATIYRIIREGNKKPKKKGPPRLVTGRTRQKLLHIFRENPKISASKAASILGIRVSDRTIRRELRKAAFSCMKIRKTQVLTKIHKEKRLNFARKHVTWSQYQWDRIVFTDEKKWNLSGNDGYVSIWREGQKKPTIEGLTNRLGGFMVWGAISANGGIALICPEGMITAETYVSMLEEDFFDKHQEDLPENFVFMHDNAPPHHARSTSMYLENKKIEVLEWPPLSPDLNPIENIWGMLSKKVYGHGKSYKNSNELWEAIVYEWHKIPPSVFRNLYDSMSERLVSVLVGRGERIKY